MTAAYMMKIKEARKIVSTLKRMPYEKRIKILSKRHYDFINTLNNWFERYPGWQEMLPGWINNLTEIKIIMRKLL